MEPSDREGDGWGNQSPGAVPPRSVGPTSATAGKEHSTCCCCSVLIQPIPPGCVAVGKLGKSEATKRTWDFHLGMLTPSRDAESICVCVCMCVCVCVCVCWVCTESGGHSLTPPSCVSTGEAEVAPVHCKTLPSHHPLQELSRENSLAWAPLVFFFWWAKLTVFKVLWQDGCKNKKLVKA